MGGLYTSSNPYVSPAIPPAVQREKAPARLMSAGFAMIAVAGIGLALAVFNFVYSFGEAQVDLSAPQFVQEVQRGAVGPLATGMQGAFAMLNIFIIVCGVHMMKMQNWGLGVAGAVLSMLNIGSCCCVAGIPVGLWSLAILTSPDIISMYNAHHTQS